MQIKRFLGINRFQSSDAWIFLSINGSEGGTSLKDLIANADSINHAIPLEKEIMGAINRLSKADLVFVKNGMFFFTVSGTELYNYIYSKKESMRTRWDRLEKLLNQSTFPSIKIEKYRLDPEQFHVVYKTYNKQFNKGENS